MASIRKVLSVGNDPELMWLRDAVLRSAGFEVLTTLDLKEGLARIERGNCGVLLMCYSLPLLSRKRLAETFRAKQPSRSDRHDHESERGPGVCRRCRLRRGRAGGPD